MKRLLVGAICAIVGTSAMADEWRLVSMDEKTAFFYDATSMQTEGKRTSTWVLFSKPQTVKQANSDYYLMWVEFDCRKMKTRSVEFYVGLIDEAPRKITLPPKRTTWTIAIPGTHWSELINHVCKRTGITSLEERSPDAVTVTIRKLAKAAKIWE